MSSEPICIAGFTPLGVILAERLTATQTDKPNVILLEQRSSSVVDDHWQSVSLLCLINLLKRCRMLQSAESRKLGVHLDRIGMNEQLVYSSIKSATQCVQKYYLNLLRQREVRFEFLAGQSDNEHRPWQSYFGRCSMENPLEHRTTYMTYGHTADLDFDRSPRVNTFQATFHDFQEQPFLKLIGPDILTLELAHLLACSCCPREIYLYRMTPSESSMLPIRETNARLVTLFEIFSNRRYQAVVQRATGEDHQPSIHLVREFQHFQIDSDADGELTYERVPIESTLKETKRNKRTYLKSFREESVTKLSSSNVRIDVVNAVPQEPLDSFPLESTFFVLPDVIRPANKTIPSESTSAPLSKVIRTLNSTPSALIRNIYDTLRVITGVNDAPQLTDLFLSVDHELCVLHNPMASKDLQSVEKTMESPEHDLQQPVDNLHDLYKIIQRPITPHGQFALSEAQVFQNDALDLQSLLLFFNGNDEIPSNELLFLFHDEHEWCHRLVLPLEGEEEEKTVVMPALYE